MVSIMGAFKILGVKLMTHANDKTREPIGVKGENYLDKQCKILISMSPSYL